MTKDAKKSDSPKSDAAPAGKPAKNDEKKAAAPEPQIPKGYQPGVGRGGIASSKTSPPEIPPDFEPRRGGGGVRPALEGEPKPGGGGGRPEREGEPKPGGGGRPERESDES